MPTGFPQPPHTFGLAGSAACGRMSPQGPAGGCAGRGAGCQGASGSPCCQRGALGVGRGAVGRWGGESGMSGGGRNPGAGPRGPAAAAAAAAASRLSCSCRCRARASSLSVGSRGRPGGAVRGRAAARDALPPAAPACSAAEIARASSICSSSSRAADEADGDCGGSGAGGATADRSSDSWPASRRRDRLPDGFSRLRIRSMRVSVHTTAMGQLLQLQRGGAWGKPRSTARQKASRELTGRFQQAVNG